MRKSPLLVLFAAVLVDMIGFGIVLPLLPYYAESMGASPLAVTMLIASFSAMQLAAAPLWGRVSDRRGRRPLLVAGLFASAVSYLIFGLATSLWMLLLSRLAAGAAGGTVSVAQAYVADSTTGEQRAAGLGHLGAASGLGIMLGPAIGGFFSHWGLGVPGYVAAGLCFLNGIAAIVLLPETFPTAGKEEVGESPRPEPVEFREWVRSFTRYPLSLLLSVYFLGISSFTAMTAILALYLERVFDIQAAGMGLIMTWAGFVTVVVRGALLGRIVAAIGEARTVRLGIVLLALTMVTFPLIPGKWWTALVISLYAFGAGTLFPSLASLVSRATDAGSQGSILGGSQVVGGFGRVIGPLWAGWAFQSIGIRSPFDIALVCLLGALVLGLRVPSARIIEQTVRARAAAR